MTNTIDLLRNAIRERSKPRESRDTVPVGQRGSAGLLGGGTLSTYGSRALESMEATSTIFSIVDLNAEKVSTTPWKLYRKARTPNGVRTEVTSHVALDALTQPNPHYRRRLFFESLQQHFELTGEKWILILRGEFSRMPLEFWPIRPDRIEPVPDPDQFIAGYMYTAPTGERIPLELDQVIYDRRPNPSNPYRGIAAVSAVYSDIETARLSSEYARNFYLNSAMPGGIIETTEELPDPAFKRLMERWRESHRGVNNAHRVAVLEAGQKWVDRKLTQRDMQFVELRGVTRDVIREAWRIHGHLLGQSDNINLANAQAAEITYENQILIPRLERWCELLNVEFLPLFDAADMYEFDFELGEHEDAGEEARERDSVALTTQRLVNAGYHPDDVASTMGYPAMRAAITDRGIPITSVPDMAATLGRATGGMAVLTAEEAREILRAAGITLGTDPPTPAAPVPVVPVARVWHPHVPRAAAGDPGPGDPDLEQMDAEWQAALVALLASWAVVETAQRTALVGQVRSAGGLADLADLSAPVGRGPAILTDAMVEMTESGGDAIVREAARQDVDVTRAVVDRSALAERADLTARILGDVLTGSARAEALRLAGTGGWVADDVADGVAVHLESLTDAYPRQYLGAALTTGQNAGRLETLRAAPQAEYYASEILDSNTCTQCRWIDKKHLGSTVDEVRKEYPSGGYVRCEGGNRCRGTVVAVWRPKQVGEGGDNE